MRYYYIDENDQTCGPVEEASFYEALRIHLVEPGTLVVAEDTEDWQPLAAVLPYYFTFGEGSAGPLPLAKLEHLAAASDEPLLVMEPDGSEWQPLALLLSPADSVQGAPAPEMSPGAMVAAIRELKAENEALKRRISAVEERVRTLTDRVSSTTAGFAG